MKGQARVVVAIPQEVAARALRRCGQGYRRGLALYAGHPSESPDTV